MAWTSNVRFLAPLGMTPQKKPAVARKFFAFAKIELLLRQVKRKC